MVGKAIRVRGIVQGVGFRPTIWRLARQWQICGTVWNDAEGVMIHAFGYEADLAAFLQQIPLQLPPLARVHSLEVHPLNAAVIPQDFQIVASHSALNIQTPIAADAATCSECLQEVFDPTNRRYRYPFTNCTHCGPRLSVVQAMPYDRGNTSMDVFPLCAACQQEYDNPADRRFHAQATCCPECGPHCWLEDDQGQVVPCADVVTQTACLLQQGYIVAIKGLGGIHLACVASNAEAVTRLRQRKQRYAKPFALMARDVAMIRRYATVTAAEEEALSAKRAPIVLLRAEGESLAAGVAPGENRLGFMLPYTPLHSLLLQALEQPLVLTSGNRSDEPQCVANEEARSRLAGIADYFLLHDRAIVHRLDDSVLRVMDGRPRLLRRARGFSPESLVLPAGFTTQCVVLAMGGELKNSFCVAHDGQAVLGQHIGDLENAVVYQEYRQSIQHYLKLLACKPQIIAVDLHQAYLSTQYGRELAYNQQLPCVAIQHHHAHLAACLAERQVALDAPPVLAAIFDGLGLGTDGRLWGGEFLLGDYRGFKRLAHFQPIAMLGGTQAIREPWRNTYAQLRHYFTWAELQRDFGALACIQQLQAKPLPVLERMLAAQLNSPLSSSCGRWFDAFAALLGLHSEQVHYEGQAAIALEVLASSCFAQECAYTEAWQLELQADCRVLTWRGLWLAVLLDLRTGVETARIAARIHHTLIAASVQLLLALSQQTDTQVIVLSGGVLQNALLLEGMSQQLRAQGKTVLLPEGYPLNDGGIALGQAVIALARPA